MPTSILGLLIMTFISGLTAWLLSKNKPVEKPVKAMLFVGYFWLSAFLQLLVVAAIYYFGSLL